MPVFSIQLSKSMKQGIQSKQKEDKIRAGFPSGLSPKGEEANAPQDGANSTQEPPQAQAGGCPGWAKGDGENGVSWVET